MLIPSNQIHFLNGHGYRQKWQKADSGEIEAGGIYSEDHDASSTAQPQ